MNDSCESPCSSSSSSCPPLLTPTGSGPDVVGMFDMDASDTLSNSSSQQNYDPMRHSFSEEELKPQPMIKKARKILVPDSLKVSLHAPVRKLNAVATPRLLSHLKGYKKNYFFVNCASSNCLFCTITNPKPKLDEHTMI